MGTRGLVVVAAIVLAACGNSTPPPTLASGTTAIASPPATSPPTTSTTTTTPTAPTVPTTTQSPDARLAEIERMVHEALVGRLQAMYDKDPDALLPWVASQKVYDDTITAMELANFDVAPTADNVGVEIEEILLDRTDCSVTRTAMDLRAVSVEALGARTLVTVLWPDETGVLRLAALWEDGTPAQIWMEECDLSPRGIRP
jgi:hypothetical protein